MSSVHSLYRTVLFSNGSIPLKENCIVTLGKFDLGDFPAFESREDFDRRVRDHLTRSSNQSVSRDVGEQLIMDPLVHWRDLERSLLAGVDAMDAEIGIKESEEEKRRIYEYFMSNQLQL